MQRRPSEQCPWNGPQRDCHTDAGVRHTDAGGVSHGQFVRENVGALVPVPLSPAEGNLYLDLAKMSGASHDRQQAATGGRSAVLLNIHIFRLNRRFVVVKT